MKKTAILAALIIVIVIGIIAGYFIISKIQESKRIYEIEKISEFNYFVYKENENYGVIDKEGKTIIEASYEKIEIPNPSKDVFICYKNDKGIAMNGKNQQLFAEYNSISAIEIKNAVSNLPYEKSVLKTEKNGKYGLIDLSGKKIFDTEYDNIQGFSNIEGELQIEKNGKIGVANIKGTTLVKPEYDTVGDDNYFNEGMKHGYVVGQKSEDGYKYGYINSKGKLLVKVEYNDILRVTDINANDGIYLIAAKNGQYGVIKNKKVIINNEYQSIEFDKTNKIFILQKGKNYGVANILGKTVISVENTAVEAKGQYIYVEKNNIKDVYDSEGNKVDIDFNQTILPTSNENYKITIKSENSGNLYGIMNSNNKQIVEPEYVYIEYVFDNYFIACGQNGKLGVIDSSGKTIIDLKYDLVQKVQGKNIIQTLLSENNITELYSEKLDKICEMQNAIIDNQNEYIKIYSNKEIKYFNANGENVKSSSVFPNNKLFASAKDEKWGYIDSNGKTVVDYKYEFASEFNEYGYAAIKQDGKWGSIDFSGKIIAQPKYELKDNTNKVEFIGEYLKVSTGFENEYYTKEK